MSKLPILLIRLYQIAISPFLPPACRFYPSCSHYAVGAYQKHGVLWGTWLTIFRLLKCHPFHSGGYDPVPARVAPGRVIPVVWNFLRRRPLPTR